MLQDFFEMLGKPPNEVRGQDVFVWAHRTVAVKLTTRSPLQV